MRIPLAVAATATALLMPFAPAPAHAQSEEPAPTGTDPVEVQRSPETTPTVVELRAAPHEGYDRVVFELDGPVPGYRVEYVDVVREPPPSDAPLELEGAATLQVTIDPAMAQNDDGIAIHGYPNVPPYPASHGCVRVSMPAIDFLWTRLPIGTAVWVY